MLQRIQILQVPLSRDVLSEALYQAIRDWVDPF
jgi:hypothetical protein